MLICCSHVAALLMRPFALASGLQVEMAPLCSATTRPGRPAEAAQVLSEQLGALLGSVVDARQLCIDAGKAAWAVYVDIYVVDAGGREAEVGMAAVGSSLPGVCFLCLCNLHLRRSTRVVALPAAMARCNTSRRPERIGGRAGLLPGQPMLPAGPGADLQTFQHTFFLRCCVVAAMLRPWCPSPAPVCPCTCLLGVQTARCTMPACWQRLLR